MLCFLVVCGTHAACTIMQAGGRLSVRVCDHGCVGRVVVESGSLTDP